MELNKEQILTALECCSKGDCDKCPNDDRKRCIGKTVTDALALIKELTEENTKLQVDYNELYEENESLRAEVRVKKKLLDKCVDLEDTVRADTVREFAERIKTKLNDLARFEYGEFVYYLISKEFIDSIASTMFRGE